MSSARKRWRPVSIVGAIALLVAIAWYVSLRNTGTEEDSSEVAMEGAVGPQSLDVDHLADPQVAGQANTAAGSTDASSGVQHPSIPEQITATAYSEMTPVSEAPGAGAAITDNPPSPESGGSADLLPASSMTDDSGVVGPGSNDSNIIHNDGPNADRSRLPDDFAGDITGPGYGDGDDSVRGPESTDLPVPLPGPGEGPQGPAGPGPGAEDPNTPPPT